MHLFDYFLFGTYMLAVLGIGFYFFRKNKDAEDYYVGSRSISPTHVGISIVATDVGGGFSIGLGGLGYLMGLSGSWLLFTGLVGAWLSAVLIIPKIKKIDRFITSFFNLVLMIQPTLSLNQGIHVILIFHRNFPKSVTILHYQ